MMQEQKTSSLLTEKGFNLGPFEPVLAAILGSAKGEEGAKVLSEAVIHGRAQVQLRDWLYCLAKGSGTHLRKRLIDAPGKTPERFVAGIEAGIDSDGEPKGLPPGQLTSETVAPDVLVMLEKAERLARDFSRPKIDDAVLSIALLESANEELKDLLRAWAPADGIEKFLKQLRSLIQPPPDKNVFQENGALNLEVFDAAGKKFCRRLREDAASLGVKKVTTRHLLYTLLGNESGLLHVALAVRGVDVKNELHAVLSRELAKPGRKRNDQLEVRRETVFPAVEQLFKESLKAAKERDAKTIGEFDIARVFVSKQSQELTRLFAANKPLDLAGLRGYLEAAEPEEESEKLKPIQRLTVKEIEKKVKERIHGQEAAIESVIPWIKRLRFDLPRDGRPAGVFLFLGPTGTGKTQLAKELARYVFGDEEMMLFMEMGQFQSKESMNMFVGAPPGYVGYGEGKLTNGLRDKPECVVLFDEIEKAFIQVFDTLLRFADEGMISDPAGPVRDGRRCIIVMTTNAGQTWLRDHLKSNPNAREDPGALSNQLFEAAMKELQVKGFRPEFLGRVDERITFLPFSEATCRKIVDSVLGREMKKFQERGVTIEVSDEVRNVLAHQAYERSMEEGARGAPRAVNQSIITPAIDLLTENETEEGGNGPTRLIASVVGLSKIELGAAE